VRIKVAGTLQNKNLTAGGERLREVLASSLYLPSRFEPRYPPVCILWIYNDTELEPSHDSVPALLLWSMKQTRLFSSMVRAAGIGLCDHSKISL